MYLKALLSKMICYALYLGRKQNNKQSLNDQSINWKLISNRFKR